MESDKVHFNVAIFYWMQLSYMILLSISYSPNEYDEQTNRNKNTSQPQQMPKFHMDWVVE